MPRPEKGTQMGGGIHPYRSTSKVQKDFFEEYEATCYPEWLGSKSLRKVKRKVKLNRLIINTFNS